MASAMLASVAVLLLAFISGAACNFNGDGTYYGDSGFAGYCAGNVPNAGQPWPPAGDSGGATLVALNSPQFGPHGTISPCGRKLKFRGSGSGSGGNPISGDWQDGMVTNLCPECKYGDLDLGKNGDGRWGIEWYWADDGDSNSGSGGNSVQSATSIRAVVPAKATLSPAKALQRRKYLYQHSLAIRLLKLIKAAKSSAERRGLTWKRWLAKSRAARARALYVGRKMLL